MFSLMNSKELIILDSVITEISSLSNAQRTFEKEKRQNIPFVEIYNYDIYI